ncbi:MAG: endonuclease/exonuclease/phosphatase family protein [Acidobacteriota bacterium]
MAMLMAGTAAGCAGAVALVRLDEPDADSTAGKITWFGPAAAGTHPARWRAGVGPPLLQPPTLGVPAVADAITFVSWNTHVGGADIVGLVNSLPNPRGPVVLLLQEVFRTGAGVPGQVDRATAFARHIGGTHDGRDAREIKAVADTLGFSVFYVPSMRNGGTRRSPEDRGNAILSNLPLVNPFAAELPFEHQRRVAVGAMLSGVSSAGIAWQVRFVSAHLLSTGGVKHAWIVTELHRARQARALTSLLDDNLPTVLAGDFNTWFGFADRTYIETSRAFPDTRVTDRRPTFHGIARLDHVFWRLPDGWHADFRRASSRFGSDHTPLVGTLRLT